jgi:hypothetical protein
VSALGLVGWGETAGGSGGGGGTHSLTARFINPPKSLPVNITAAVLNCNGEKKKKNDVHPIGC